MAKDDLYYKDVGRGFKEVEKVKGEQTVRVYISVPLFGNIRFGGNLCLGSGDRVYTVEEIPGGQWNPTDDVDIKLIERR